MRTFVGILVLGILFAGSQIAAHEMKHDMKHAGIMVEKPWARASAGPAKAGAAYLSITNMGDDVDRLINVKSDLANRTEIHTHMMEGGIMRMQQVDGIDVAPGTPTVLQPGGVHIMFMGLKKPFMEGQKLPLTLVFEKAGAVEIEFVVQGVGAKEPADGMPAGHKHSHGS